ncbi:hypothetical protein [Salisediminibacterium beveridgei]|uniref:Rhodanese domain-containing protein n=1 Tax=Salisediminibacterium beveridgei TaxID=632773 RepID=A0A1D7QVB4_9BACI|nr:hypothetical protein [Salisediminibacterium beveridgei]AOM82951.1 hypothetical protein BBEV_1590 [Salisediminibacterium beveridgei]
MSYVLIVLLLLITGLLVYQRYSAPHTMVNYGNISTDEMDDEWVLDIREYQDALRRPSEAAINVPLAYLKRHYPKEMPRQLILVANDRVEVNLACRFLERKGYKVIGYQMCPADFRNNAVHAQNGALHEPCKTTSC